MVSEKEWALSRQPMLTKLKERLSCVHIWISKGLVFLARGFRQVSGINGELRFQVIICVFHISSGHTVDFFVFSPFENPYSTEEHFS